MPLDPKGHTGQPVLQSAVKPPPSSSALLDQSVGLFQGKGAAAKGAGRLFTPPGLQLRVQNNDAAVGRAGALRPKEIPMERTMNRETTDCGQVYSQLEQEVGTVLFGRERES